MLGRGERFLDHPPCGNNRNVAAGALDVRDTEGHDVLALGHVAGVERQHVVVEIHDRVVVANGRCHESLGIGWRGRKRHFQPRNSHHRVIEAIGVLPSPAGGESVAGLQHQRNSHLASRHVSQAGSLVEHLVHGHQHELAHPKLDDGTQSRNGGTHGDANLGSFGNRCNANPVLAEHLQHGVALGHGHVLTVENYVRIPLHFFDNGGGHRFSVHHFPGHSDLLMACGQIAAPKGASITRLLRHA